MACDVRAINRSLRDHGVDAGVPARTREVAMRNSMVALPSHCAYRLGFAPGVPFKAVESRRRELRAAVAAARMAAGWPGSFALDVLFDPLPTVVIDSPVVEPLALPQAFDLPPHTGAFGEVFDFSGRRVETVNLAKHHQSLIAALSQHGKSTSMRAVLASMLASTGPDQLRVVLIDLKNEQLVPFRNLPHVVAYAGDQDAAVRAVELVDAIKGQRIESLARFPFRVLLVIDELAELNDGKSEDKPGSVRHRLASIMKTGAAMGINVLAATQNPTAKEIGASVARAFTARWVGRVGSASSAAFVAGRPGSGAENLRRLGSFVAAGPSMVRVQAYYSDLDDTYRRCEQIAGKWSGHPVAPVNVDPSAAGTPELSRARAWAGPARDDIDVLADRLAEIRASDPGASLRAQCMALLDRPYAGGHIRKFQRVASRLAEREASTTTNSDSAIFVAPSLVDATNWVVVAG
jgi:DNA segregation ATPase FtsK/SpoIIIE-like protein